MQLEFLGDFQGVFGVFGVWVILVFLAFSVGLCFDRCVLLAGLGVWFCCRISNF